jgi:hypothetical protein
MRTTPSRGYDSRTITTVDLVSPLELWLEFNRGMQIITRIVYQYFLRQPNHKISRTELIRSYVD